MTISIQHILRVFAAGICLAVVTTPLAAQQAPRALGSPAPPVVHTWGSRLTGAIQSASNTVTGAMTPRRVPPVDPLDLSAPSGDSSSVLLAAARLHERRGNFPAAEKQYVAALRADNKNVAAMLQLARLYDRQDKYQQAVQVYQHAIQMEPRNPIALNDLGLCYARRNELHNAVAHLERAIGAAPHNRLYRNNLATVLVEMNNPRAAFEHLAAANPEAVAHYNIGVLLFKKGDTHGAASHLQQAAAKDPSLTQASQLLARVAPSLPTHQSPGAFAGNNTPAPYRNVSAQGPAETPGVQSTAPRATGWYPEVRQPEPSWRSPAAGTSRRAPTAPAPQPWSR